MSWNFLRAALAALAISCAVPAAAQPSAAQLTAAPAPLDALLAPDGSRFAARDGDAPDTRLILTELDGPEWRARPIALPEGERLLWFRWAGSGRIVAGLEPITGGRVQLAAIDPETGAHRWLGDTALGHGQVIHVDRDGRFLLMSASPRPNAPPAVHRIDLTTGRAVELVRARANVWHWVADSNGVVRGGMADRGDPGWMLYRRGEGEAFSRAGGGADPATGIAEFVPVGGSDQGYALAENPAGRVALYRYDLRAGRLGTLVHEHARVDLDGYRTGADGAMLGIEFTDDRDETLWFDSGLAAAQAEIDAALPGLANRIVSFSDDRARMLLVSHAPVAPGILYFYDRATRRLTRLAEANPALAGQRLSAMRPVRYRARDGVEIRGYLTLPEGRDPASLPLIVLAHGGPFARTGWDYDPWVQYLASRGYAVLQPNFRGSTGYGRDYAALGDGQWGRGMQDDLADGVAWLAGQGVIDPARTCIMGASYGGYAAMWAAVRAVPAYRCAIAFAGISDVAAQLDFDRETFSERGFRAWRSRIQGSAPSLAALSPLAFVDRLTMPILIAHGDDDDVVPPGQSHALHRALTRLGRAHDYVAYAGEGHTLRDPANEADFLDRVGAFLDRHNPS